MGYVKAGSLPSLFMGTLGAIALQVCLIGIWKKRAFGGVGALFLSWVFTLFFLYRFSIAWKFMPGGLMALLSLTALIMANRVKKMVSTHPS